MNKYQGLVCPICEKPLDDGNEVVVCPQCGAPYHKDCVVKKGACIFVELHAQGKSWQPENAKTIDEDKIDGKAPCRCSRCGTINPVDGLFCQVCGNQLNKKDDSQNTDEKEKQSFPNVPPFANFEMPYNPFTTPFGGVGAQEEIDGLPAKDLAIFVGKSSHYYIPKFKQISKDKTSVVNWSAFFFQGGFFLYRKMYALGIVYLLFTLLLKIPSSILMFNNIGVSLGTAPLAIDMKSMAVLELTCSFIAIAVRIVMSLFANKLYKRSCYKKINKIRALNLTQSEYYQSITKKGSVAARLILTLVVVYFCISFVSMYALILLGG
ncbi:MAG: RING finger protein [Oscillospiraceae bacterium]